MRIRTRSIEYEAICLKRHVSIGAKSDLRAAVPGEYLLIAPDGGLSLATKAELHDGAKFEIEETPLRKTTKRPGRPKGKRGPQSAPKKAAPVAPRRRAAPALRSDQMAQAKRLIEGGAQIAAAAREIGIPYGTVYAWAKMNNWTAAE